MWSASVALPPRPDGCPRRRLRLYDRHIPFKETTPCKNWIRLDKHDIPWYPQANPGHKLEENVFTTRNYAMKSLSKALEGGRDHTAPDNCLNGLC